MRSASESSIPELSSTGASDSIDTFEALSMIFIEDAIRSALGSFSLSFGSLSFFDDFVRFGFELKILVINF